jgi:phosphoribosylformylglycinamidine synthase PurS subunit
MCGKCYIKIKKGGKMKVQVKIFLKKEVLDTAGDAVGKALRKLGFAGVKDVRIGKIINIELDDEVNVGNIKEELKKMCDDILANPVIEDYEVLV